MATASDTRITAAAPRGKSVDYWRKGPLSAFFGDDTPLVLTPDLEAIEPAAYPVVFSGHLLQDVVDYRLALQTWFAAVSLGGYLVVVVPHAFLYERQLELPTPLNPNQRRLYTPGVLAEQVEEALIPNSYRIRLLRDDDADHDYASPEPGSSTGGSDVVLVIEKIAAPAWTLDIPFKIEANAPNYAFDPPRTRVEMPTGRRVRRVLILKFDHLGDFIMGLPALEHARAVFHDAHITLVVGSWNLQMARASGVADEIIPFDVFPRNSTEEEVDVGGKTALFTQIITGEYDLAIDLRTDLDTRFLLRKVRAGLRAGIGTRSRFPFLDIFLPLDFNRNEPETAREYKFNNHDFMSQGPVIRADYRNISRAETAERFCAIIWGPYRSLRTGRYFFDPWIELDPRSDGQLLVDVCLDARRVVHQIVPPVDRLRLPFTVEEQGAQFEFRIWTVEGMPSIDLSFYGGRLIREGAASVLHQSEYLTLLIDLVDIRLRRTGVLTSVADLA